MMVNATVPGNRRTWWFPLHVLTACVVALPLLATGSAWAAPGGAAPDGAPPSRGDGYHAGSTFAAHEDFADSRVRATTPSGIPGVDVSNWQGDIDWAAVADDGIEFAYIKATGGTDFVDQSFDDNYVESYAQDIIRGAYHFARPNQSGPIQQARFFVNNGGDWSDDGRTLPPMLDMEYNPSGDECYGLTEAEMVEWVRGFSDEVKRLSGRYPVIYTTTNWWRTCTGDSGAFGETNPLMIARWADEPYPLPNWELHTFWQYTSSGQVAGIRGDVDRDVFNAGDDRLESLATCTYEQPC